METNVQKLYNDRFSPHEKEAKDGIWRELCRYVAPHLPQLPEGKIVDFNAPIDVSNVALVDPKTDKRTKVGYKLQDGKKVRYAKASGTILN